MESQEFTMFGRFLGENIISKKITWKIIESNRFYVTHKEEAIQYLIYKGYKLEDDIFKDKEETGGGDTPTDNPGDNPGTGDTPVDPNPNDDPTDPVDEPEIILDPEPTVTLDEDFIRESKMPYIVLEAKDDCSMSLKTPINNLKGSLEYSKDGENWTKYDGAELLGSKIYLRGTGNEKIYPFTITGSDEIECSGNIESLLDYNTVNAGEHPKMGSSAFEGLFKQQKITKAPVLPATELSDYCYSCMFMQTPIKKSPILPAKKLKKRCYNGMFSSCSLLEESPELPAMELAEYCYSDMFNKCTSLTKTPEKLPSLKLAVRCYNSMYYGCTKLNKAPLLPANKIEDGSYAGMFSGTTVKEIHCHKDLENNENAQAKIFGINGEVIYDLDNNYSRIREKNRNIKVSNEAEMPYVVFHTLDEDEITIKAQTNNSEKAWDGTMEYSFDNENWNNWNGEEIKNNKIFVRGENNTFVTKSYNFSGGGRANGPWIISGNNSPVHCDGNIESLINYKKVIDKEHPEMGQACFDSMFQNNTLLEKAPYLGADKVADYGYTGMFAGCKNLKETPELPATEVGSYCYSRMFVDCSSIKKSSELPALKMTKNCYSSMFYQCSSLEVMPELPATELAEKCYESMFKNCTSLKETVIELPATTLADYCYLSMFEGCSNITEGPELPATTLASNYGYGQMFKGTDISDIHLSKEVSNNTSISQTTLGTSAELHYDLPEASIKQTGRPSYPECPDCMTIIKEGNHNFTITIPVPALSGDILYSKDGEKLVEMR